MNVHKYDAPTREHAGPQGSLWVWMPKEWQWRLCHFSRVNPGDFWLDFDSIPIPQDIPVEELIAPLPSLPVETEEEAKARREKELDDALKKIIEKVREENPNIFELPKFPNWPIGPDEFPRPGDFPVDKPIGNCTTCGIELFQVMGYACPRTDCPTGMGPVQC